MAGGCNLQTKRLTAGGCALAPCADWLLATVGEGAMSIYGEASDGLSDGMAVSGRSGMFADA